jgi:hypothetical protein
MDNAQKPNIYAPLSSINLCLLHCVLDVFQIMHCCETDLNTDIILQRATFSHLQISPPSGAYINKSWSFDSFPCQSLCRVARAKGLHVYAFILLNIHHLHYYFK